jgi:hypothetical protein
MKKSIHLHINHKTNRALFRHCITKSRSDTFINHVTMSEDSNTSDPLVSSDNEQQAPTKNQPNKKKTSTGKKSSKKREAPWDPFGEDGILLARVVVSGKCNPNSFQEFLDNCPQAQKWLDDKKVERDNLRRNIKKVVKRFHEYLLVGACTLLMVVSCCQSVLSMAHHCSLFSY